MRNIKVLDCTLRDGGCVNDFNFGTENMHRILRGVEESGADIIECGYIDEQRGTTQGRTQYNNEESIVSALNLRKKSNTKYVAMIDIGKYDVEKLSRRTDKGIDGIRLAFHKKDRDKCIELGKIILEKGYELYIQPMLVLRYTDAELIHLIEKVNTELPGASAFYIVDSFGEMRSYDLQRITSLVDHNLNKSMPIGFHSHNNLQLSYSNACALLQFPTTRDTIIDVSILGMGKGAGNLNAELFEEHLNLFYNKKYNVRPLLGVIDDVINQIREEYYWGYAVQYYLSSINHCTPSYAAYFYEKHTLSIDELSSLLIKIDDEKKISFDRQYAHDLYYANTKNAVDDANVRKELQKEYSGKHILLIAPGKSVSENLHKILTVAQRTDVKTILLNHTLESVDAPVFCTKNTSYESAMNGKRDVIVTSNIRVKTYDNQRIVNYSSYNKLNGEDTDVSGIILINLLISLGVVDIYLAGFDGFTSEIIGNYYDKSLEKPVSVSTAEERNEKMRTFLEQIGKTINLEFITKTKYK